MRRGRAALIVRTAILASSIVLLEIACRTGIVDSLTIIPPSEMLASMVGQIGRASCRERVYACV